MIFSIMGVCIKYASALYSTSEIVMYRGAVGVVVMYLIIIARGESLRTPVPLQHLWRGAVGAGALWLWFFAISTLPMATAMTLNYMSPVWMALFLLVSKVRNGGSSFDWRLTLAILVSFSGVLLLLQPVFQSSDWISGIAGLMSGVLAAMALLQVRNLGRLGEPEHRVVFYFCLSTTLAGFIGVIVQPVTHSAPGGHEHSWTGYLLLLLIGVTATIAQYAMTRAYQAGKTLLSANLHYLGILFSTAWGVVLWDERLGLLASLGIAIIVISSISTTVYQLRQAR